MLLDPTRSGFSNTQLVSGGAERIFIETKGPSSVAAIDPTTRKVFAATSPSSTTRPRAEVPLPVPGGAVVFDLEPYGIAFLADDGRFEHLYAPSKGWVPTEIKIDRSAANAIVWAESVYGATGYEQVTLWTSPAAQTAADFRPRRIGRLPSTTQRGGAMAANRDAVLTIADPTTATITRISDGAIWSVAGEPGDDFVLPLWIDDDEVWIATAPAGAGAANMSGILRIRRDSLGAPTGAVDR